MIKQPVKIALAIILKFVLSCLQHTLQQEREFHDTKIKFLCSYLNYISRKSDGRSGRVWMYKRTGNYWEGDVANYNDSQWITNFRMTKQTFYDLLNLIEDDMKPDTITVRVPICTSKRMAIAIYTLASSAEYRTVAHNFGVSKSTVGNCLKRFCMAINKHLQMFINMPTREEMMDIAKRIQKDHYFPQVIGCIDGTHIPITAPIDGKKDYTNRKGWESMVLQALVDDHYMFRDINVVMPGSVHDATVFKQSGLFRLFEQLPKAPILLNEVEIPLLILGDPAYPLLPWLIKPFVGHQIPAEKESFNCYHSSVRICVENAFGRLKARWRILCKKMDISIDMAPYVIATCCALHNVCETKHTAFSQNVLDSSSMYYPQPYSLPQLPNDPHSAGSRVRQAIVDHLQTTQPLRQSMRFVK